MTMKMSLCLRATTLHADDAQALGDKIEAYRTAGMEDRVSEKAAVDDLIAQAQADLSEMSGLLREQHPGMFVAANDAALAQAEPATEATAAPEAKAADQAPVEKPAGKIDVRPLDIINAKTGESAAERDLDLALGPVFSRSQQTDTPAFKAWFGESKAVDADGKPLVVYHGTVADFDAFKAPQDLGTWFTSRPEEASEYAQYRGRWQGGVGENVMPAYLAIKNPATGADMDAAHRRLNRNNAVTGPARSRWLRKDLEAQGFDGFNEGRVWVAFRPEQIKSATGNSGAFDPTSPSIVASRSARGAGAPFSSLERMVTDLAATWPGLRAKPVVVKTESDLPADILTALESQNASDTTRGIRMPDGRVFLIADQLGSMQEAQATLFHEVYGHEGMRAFLGDKYKTQMALLRMANPKLAAEANTWFAQYGADQIAARVQQGMTQAAAGAEVRALAVEEALADRASDGTPPKAWKGLMAALQRALRKIGLDWIADKLEAMTEAETYSLLMSARQAIQDGVQPARELPAWLQQPAASSTAPTWYSALLAEVNKSPMNAGTAGAWTQYLDAMVKRGTVKADEIEWTGLREFLAMTPGKITKDQVGQFLAENGVRVTETVLSESPSSMNLDWDEAAAPDGFTSYYEARFYRGGGYEDTVGIGLSEGGGWWVYNDGREIAEDLQTREEAETAARNAVAEVETSEEGDTRYAKYQLPGGPLSRDTEILSRDGWLRMDEVQIGDIVMTRRDADGALEWQPVEAVPTIHANKLYHFKNQSIDMRVTACHNMLVKRRRRSGPDLFRVKAEDLWGMSECVAPLVGRWAGKATDGLYGYAAGDAAELIGWYIAEGSAVTENGKKSTLAISQSRTANPEKCDRIEALLGRMNIAWNYVASGPAYYLSIKTMDRGLVDVLHAQGDSRHKFVPGFIFDQPPNVLARLMDGLLLGDGHLANVDHPIREPRWTYHSNSKQLADDMQLLALLSGLRAVIGQRAHGLYEVRLNSKQWASIDDAKHAIVDYNDTAYCVTVQNHAIYVRTGGVAAFTGNSNYREVLLTLPVRKTRYERPASGQMVDPFGDLGALIAGRDPAALVEAPQSGEYVDDAKNYRSTHWDQPNVIAHIRLNDRIDSTGARVLFVEEVQGDWGQSGKKKGFNPGTAGQRRFQELGAEWDALSRVARGPAITEQAAKAKEAAIERQGQISDEMNAISDAQRDGVPIAPFVTATDKWVTLTLKRVIKIAVDEGYAKVAFVTGEQSAERYDMSKQVDEILFWGPDVEGEFQPEQGEVGISIYATGGQAVKEQDIVSHAALSDLVGKELSERIINGDAPQAKGHPRGVKALRGLDLKVGGEGMKAFYDKIVPSVAKDVLRKVGGGQMGDVTIGLSDSKYADILKATGKTGPEWEAMTPQQRHKAIAEAGLAYTQPGFDITDTMREKAAGGMPLFKRDPPPVETQRTAEGRPTYRGQGLILDFPLPTERVEIIPGPGQEVLNYPIMPETGFESLGFVELLVENGKPISLLDIEVNSDGRDQGIGRRVIETLLAANPQADLTISNIVPAAQAFWERMGVPIPNLEQGAAYDGTLNWKTYAQAQADNRGTGRAARGQGRANQGAGRSADAGAESRVQGSMGQTPVLSRSKIVGQTKRAHTAAQLTAMRNVGFQVETPTLDEKVKALWRDAGKKLAQGLADQFAPIKDISQEAYGLLRLSKGASGAFEVLLNGGRLKLTDGVYDFDDAHKGGVIDSLLKPLVGEHHDFLRWVAANRAERLTGEGKENLFSLEDISALKTLAEGKTEFDYTLRHGARAGTVTRDRTLMYRDSLITFNEFNRNTLDMAEQSGLIDGESRRIWAHEFYVPFYRVSDEGAIGGVNVKSGMVRQQAFKALKGGKQALNADLLDNTLMNWAHLLDAAAKNRAAKATLEAAEAMGVATPAPEAVAREMANSIGKKEGVVWFMDGGAKRFYLIEDPYVLTAISSLEYSGMRNPVMNAMGTFKRVLTIGVTASPYFKIRNLIRDSVQVIGTSSISPNIAGNVAAGWKLTDPKSDPYFRLLAGGGTIHFGTMMEGNEAKRVQALVESGVDASTILNSDHKVKAFYRKFIEPGITAYNELGNRGEAVNRASLYEQLRSQGASHADASLQARDLMDFSMQGSFTSIRFLSQVVPFFNARIQGMYKLGRGAKEDPARFSAVIGAASLMSLGLLLAFSDDDDWKKREEWDRNNYWWFKFGGMAFRIPKPFEIGAIATLAERGFELAFDKEMTGKRFRTQLLTLLGDNLSMNPVPQLFKPMLDVYANKDAFTGRPIETMSMEKLKAEYRFTDRTSMTARGISTAANAATSLIGAEAPSPVQIDHMLRGYFGWLGSFVVGVGDVLARPATGQPARATMDHWKVATGGMVSDLRDAPSRYISQMYAQSKEIDQAYGTWRELLKQGKTAEATEFRKDNQDLIVKHSTSLRVRMMESALNQRIRQIEKSDMESDAKRASIRVLQAQKDRVARTLSTVN